MRSRHMRAKVIVLSLAIGSGAIWVTTHLRAQVNPPDGDRAQFGMIGVARGQTARLNVVNVAVDNPDIAPCPVQLQFLDSHGGLLAQGQFTLGPGEARYLDIVNDRGSFGGSRPGVPPDVGDRQQLRAAWNNPPDPDRAMCPSDNFIATVEVFGRDGQTTVLYPGFANPPEPDVPAPL